MWENNITGIRKWNFKRNIKKFVWKIYKFIGKFFSYFLKYKKFYCLNVIAI